MDYKYDVFISYSSKDQKIAEGACAYLEQQRIRCFVAYRDIPKGIVWANAIDEALTASRMMVVIFSESFNNSEQVDKEIGIASDEHKPILTFRISNDKFKGAKRYHLGNLNWIDAFPNPDAYFGKLSEGILKLLDKSVETENTDNEKPHNNNVLAESPQFSLKLKADMDCIFYLDDEERTRLKAGVMQKIQLLEGEYELRFVSSEDEADSLEMDFTMPKCDKLLKVGLKEVRDKRKQSEESAHKVAEDKRLVNIKNVEEKGLSEEELKTEEEHIAEEVPKAEDEKCEDLEVVKERMFTVGGVSFKMIPVEGTGFNGWIEAGVGAAIGTLVWPGVGTVAGAYLGKRLSGLSLKGIFGTSTDEEKNGNVEDNVKSSQSVTLDDFMIGETEVTQELWEAVMGTDIRQQRDKANKECPLRGEGKNYPMYYVSWNDCKDFIRKLNSMTGQTFRLPTEVEWKYAASGGKNSQGTQYAGSDCLDDVAWYDLNSNHNSHPVGTKEANKLGLYDMSGNVWEWCEDSQLEKGSYKADRLCCGGSWFSNEERCQVSSCYSFSRYSRESYIGLRLALSTTT